MSTVDNIDIKFNVITDALDSAANKLQSIGSSISNLGNTLTNSVSKPIAGLAEFGLKYNSTMQDLQTSFKVMLGSQEKAVAMTDKLNKMGAQTPFETAQLAEYTKTMLAFGYTENNVLPIMSRLGDVSLGNNAKMSSLTRTMGQINALGKLQGGDLNQLIGQGWNPLNEIMKKTGETTEQIRKRMSAGKVTYKEVEDALVSTTSKGGQFYNGMAEGSKTLSGQISTLKDNFSMLIGDLTKPIFDKLQQILPKIISFVGMLQEKFKSLSPAVKTAILVTGGIVSAIGPLLAIGGTIITFIGGIIGGISSIVGVIGAISASPIIGTVAGIVAAVGALVGVFAVVGTAIGYILVKTGALKQIMDIAITAFNTAKPIVIDLAMNAFAKLKQFIGFVKGALDDVAKVAKPFINDTLAKAKPVIQDIVQALGKFGQAWISFVGEKIKEFKRIWDSVFPYLAPVLKVIFENIKNDVMTALNVIKTVINVATAIIKGDWGKVWEGIKTIFSSILDTIKTNTGNTFNLIKGAIVKVFTEIKNAIVAKLSEWWNAIANVFNSILSTIINICSSIKNKAVEIWNGIVNAIVGVVNWFKSIVVGIVQGAMNMIVGAFTWMYKHNYYFKAIVDFIVLSFNTVKNFIFTVWNEIKAIFTTVITAISTFLTTAWNFIKDNTMIAFNAVKSVVLSVWNAINGVVINVVSAIKGYITTAWNAISSVISGVLNTIKSVISTAWNFVYNIFFSKTSQIRNVVSTAFNAVKDTISGIADGAYKWGSNLISNFLDGFKSKIKAIKDAASDVASTVAKFLGFHSPAKEGAGRDADKWIPNLMAMLTGGFIDGENKIKAITSRISHTMAIDLQGQNLRSNLLNSQNSGFGNYNSSTLTNNNQRSVVINYSGGTTTQDKNNLVSLLRSAGVY
jgi:tape measure domain-containing protein